MKLYAKITSDRASKGQGGNKYLNIDILIDDRNYPLYSLNINRNNDESTDINLTDNLLRKSLYQIRIKAKAQKCYCSDTELSIPHYSDDHKEFICFHDKPCLNCPETKGKKQKGEGRCWAQVGIDWCNNKATHGDYCKKHADEFPL